jgi:hypothetical protein
VNNVFAEFVIARRNPHLRAGQTIRAIGLRLGRGFDIGER